MIYLIYVFFAVVTAFATFVILDCYWIYFRGQTTQERFIRNIELANQQAEREQEAFLQRIGIAEREFFLEIENYESTLCINDMQFKVDWKREGF